MSRVAPLTPAQIMERKIGMLIVVRGEDFGRGQAAGGPTFWKFSAEISGEGAVTGKARSSGQA